MEITRMLRHDRSNAQGQVSIHLRICWRGHKVRLSTGHRVLPADWDERRQQLRGKAKFSSLVNHQLDVYETNLRAFVYDSERSGQIVTKAMVQAEISRIRIVLLGQPPKVSPARIAGASALAEPGIGEFIQRFVRERSTDRSESWAEAIRLVGHHLEAFRPGIDWADLTLPTLNSFKVYLQQEMNHSDATLQTYVGILRGLLKSAGQYAISVPTDWAHLSVRRVGAVLLPELRVEEVSRLHQVCLQSAPTLPLATLEQTRWYFLMACYTGLRHSDLAQLRTPKLTTIDEQLSLEIVQQKTKTRVIVPLPARAEALLQQLPVEGGPPDLMLYNRSLKQIGQQAGLDRPVRVGSYYNGTLLAEEMPLYQALNSHTARRTFGSLMTAYGMPTRTLQVLMGHQSITSTEKYSRVNDGTVRRQVQEVWQRLDG